MAVRMAVRLKRDSIADLELEHLAVRPHLVQEPQPLHDPVVQVDEFCLGKLVDVDPHGCLPRSSPELSSSLPLFIFAAERSGSAAGPAAGPPLQPAVIRP